ncbi:MAG: hypothetical protein WA749_14295 [Gelidibacter sp.]
MKLIIYLLALTTSFTSAFSSPITALITFENNTDNTSIKGVLYITETNQSLLVNALENFTVELPKSGKYQFRFYSEDVYAFTSYPLRITERKNVITIRLENKTEKVASAPTVRRFPRQDISSFSTEQLEEGLAWGTINFIVHGLVAIDSEAANIFKTAYGIGFTSENCVVDPISFKTAMQTNKKIETYLISKFGHDWKNKLPATPFGLQLDRF